MKPVLVLTLALGSISLSNAESSITKPLISTEVSPLRKIAVPGRPMQQSFALVRKPPGPGPFPAVVFLHGTLGQWPIKQLTSVIETGQTLSRFLAAGYVTVAIEFSSREADPQSKEALKDCLAAVEMVKKMPEVDPKSVVVYGGSGGGSLVLEIAGETRVAAGIADEPAMVLFTGLLTNDVTPGRAATSADSRGMMAESEKYYTPEVRKFTRDKMSRISCPILIVRGKMSPLNHMNEQVVVPELLAMGKTVKEIIYEGQPHAFSKGEKDPDALLKFFNDSQEFLLPLLTTKPKAMDSKLIQIMPASNR